MTDWGHLLEGLWGGVLATSPSEAASVALALVYSVLAIKRNRWCWVAGGLGAAITIYLSLDARLPMQAALQVYYVLISVYGWWHWTREEEVRGTLLITTLPLAWHVVASVAVVLVSALTAQWLASHTHAAWPFLDSLTTWGSLYATWLEARVKLENWLYWLFLDSVLGFLFAAQGLYLLALLSVVYLGVSVIGFVKWLKTYRVPIPVG
jgi:nicotinamide mononucleotide transporter